MRDFKPDTNLNRLHVLVTKKQYAWINKESFKQKLSMGKFMRQLITKAMQNGGEK